MAQYIDREKAIDAACEVLRGAIRCGKAKFTVVRWIVEELDIVPAADVAPVVHARWETPDGITRELDTCSVCNWVNLTGAHCNGFNYLRYCPNCGARMDKEATNGSDTD